MDAVTVFDLTKQYGDTFALKNINLHIPEGTAMGVVGRKDAGKTTLVRLLSGLCRPTSGECEIMGLSPVFEAEKLHAVTGVVLDSAKLYKNMTVLENMSFFASLHNIESNDALDTASLLLRKLGIWNSRDTKISELPTNVVRRASIARALIHRPRVLLVDEPDGGFHNETMEAARELFEYLVREEGDTLVFCGEDMDYAETFCDNFAILKDGELFARGDFETLRKAAGVRFKVSMRVNSSLRIKEINSMEEIPALVAQAVHSGSDVYEVKLIRPTMEEIYESYISGGIRKAGDFDEQGDTEPQEFEEGNFTFADESENEPEQQSEELEVSADDIDELLGELESGIGYGFAEQDEEI